VSEVPQNANDVVLHLLTLSRQLDQTTSELNTADTAAVYAREDAKLAESTAFLSADGPMDIRKHTSIVATHEVRLAAEVADAMVRGLQRTVRSLQSRIDVGRTYGATIRSEIQLAGSGVHGA
jgi:hypothetical protein